MDVVPVDPEDHAAFAAWFAVVRASQRAISPEPGDTLEELQGTARAAAAPHAPCRAVVLAAREGHRTVGAVLAELPVRDNTHLVITEQLHVHPDARRLGVGTALLDALHAVAAADGRRDVVVGLEEVGADADGTRVSPGRAFLRARGLTEASVEVRRDLDLPVDPARLDALEAACRPHARGYVLRAWEGSCPDDLLEDRALLGRRMSTDAPHGDLPLQEEEWDGERVRRREQTAREAGRRSLAVGAVHEASGRMVAFTELGLPPGDPSRAYQWETLVLREHRGHRLGTLVKVGNLRHAAARWPQCRYVSTWNATSNAPMIAVNEALGCRVVGAWSDWQQPVQQPVGGTGAR